MRRLVILFSFIICTPLLLSAQQPADTMQVKKDTSLMLHLSPVTLNQYNEAWTKILNQNHFLNTSGTPEVMVVKAKRATTDNTVFYLLTGLVLVLALTKFFFARYFSNLFRVFFNTSLRQSQLTDQLLQAKLPSLFFNAFFILSGGFYIYFLLVQYGFISIINRWYLLPACILVLGIIYIVKYSSLKFTGWVTGNSHITDTYIFIIFLIAKILGVMIIPFIIIMAFADTMIASGSALISLLLVGFLLLLRFFRSYGLIQNQLKVSRFHFFLYIIGIEIMPLLLIYKGLLLLLSKNP